MSRGEGRRAEIGNFRCQVSGFRRQDKRLGEVLMKSYMDVEDLEVYQKLCRLHIEICDLSHAWPSEERYEIGSQIRRCFQQLPSTTRGKK